MDRRKLSQKMIDLCLKMNDSGLNQGTSGNISARCGDLMLITPSGIAYDQLRPDDIVSMAIDSDAYTWQGALKPSSEWHFHRAILRDRPEFSAVVHTHSMFSSILSISREDIPACHYMIAAFGGNTVRCADYATFGTQALSENILSALAERSACLLANHGLVAAGYDLDNAMWAAVELETLAKQYYYASQRPGMTLLSDDEMQIVIEKFKSYGQK